MRWPALVNILHDPLSVPVGPSLVESGSNRQTSRDPLYRLMEEPGMAGSEASDKFVHAALECLGVIFSKDRLAAVASDIRPLGSVEVWIKILLRHLCNGLIENLRPLIEGQHGWSRI